MKLTKSETNNAIVVELTNVREHPNADRLKLATVLGTQVIVGLDSYNGQKVIYFDSNLCLSNEYLSNNNLYSDPELNRNKVTKGYFGSNGRVKAQKFRGEVSNGYVAELHTLLFKQLKNIDLDTLVNNLQVGMEFTHIDDVEICKKYIPPHDLPGQPGSRNRIRYDREISIGVMFKRHWDTKQFMREYQNIPDGRVWIEEKVHGTSGRTGYIEVTVYRKWYQFWKPKTWKEWKVISGTRRMAHIDGHISSTRKEIHDKLAPNLHKGETVYYEIFGHSVDGKEIQSGFSYDCAGGEYKVMLYRVTITTPDGFSVDLPREAVYHRAEELGLLKPVLIYPWTIKTSTNDLTSIVTEVVHGNSAFANHIKEGVVVWFQNTDGTWSNMKHKSEEFLVLESKQRDNDKNDVEDLL